MAHTPHCLRLPAAARDLTSLSLPMEYEHDVNILQLPEYGTIQTSITSLRGAPQRVHGSFSCMSNLELTTLEHGPKWVGRHYNCTRTSITSLEHVAETVVGHLIASRCKILDLHDVHRHLRSAGELRLFDNEITSSILGLMLIDLGYVCTDITLQDGVFLDLIINRWKNRGRQGVLGFQRELLDLGYDELART